MAAHRSVNVNLPNALTLGRIALVPVFIWLYLAGGTGNRIAATLVFMVAAATDQLDGHLARSRNLETDFGRIADPIADKALVGAALVLLSAAHFVPWWVTILILIRELGITALRFVMIRRQVMAASKGGKLKTVTQMLFIWLLLIPWHGFVGQATADVVVTIAHVIMYVALAITVLTGVQYCVDAYRIAHE
ncbi:MAG: CDP-diacylglycerol--glycerol-3-phosphate 3-phosphatidyltransferase [Bowdeniella nasicola]|nr:CDP-diacylglycerol--glycerol-3-phosphate 3-phosphatidyltransferase [Bowdeniella nasicola]